MINTDFSQYKSYGDAEKHAKLMSKEIISDVKTDLAKNSLEDLQKHDQELEDVLNGVKKL